MLGIREVDMGVTWKNAEEQQRIEWSKQPDFPAKPYLARGSVSVLVSDLDSIASEIALHFALQDDKMPTLYISTLHRKVIIDKMVEQYSSLKESSHFTIEELQPEHISEGKLLSDIKGWINQRRTRKASVIKVVVDNIYKLSKKFPLLHDEGHFLAALFTLLRSEGVVALIVDTVEVGEGTNPLPAHWQRAEIIKARLKRIG